MSNGDIFTLQSDLSFEEAVTDITEGGGMFCQVDDSIIINTLQIASIEKGGNTKRNIPFGAS